MNANMLRAIVAEEWIRVRAWWAWALVALAVDGFVLVPAMEHLWAGTSDISWKHDFYNLLSAFFTFLAILASIAATAMIATYSRGKVISAELPVRYLTLPVSRFVIPLTQLVCRVLFAVPVALLLLEAFYHEGPLHKSDLVMMFSWSPIAVAAACAVGMWWRRLGPLSLGLWVLAPALFWGYAVADLHSQFPEAPFIAFAIALAGVATGLLLLARGAPLESQTTAWPLSQKRGATRREPTPFSGPRAAVRWAESPRGVWWPAALAFCIAVPFALWSMIPVIPYLQNQTWLPWTPKWLIAASYGQFFLMRLFNICVTCLGFTLPAIIALQSFGFLRRNYLQRPFAARLPIGPGDYSVQAGLILVRHALLVPAIGLVLFVTVHAIAAEPNVGSGSVWDPRGFSFFFDGNYVNIQGYGRNLDAYNYWSEYADYGVRGHVLVWLSTFSGAWASLSALAVMIFAPLNWLIFIVWDFAGDLGVLLCITGAIALHAWPAKNYVRVLTCTVVAALALVAILWCGYTYDYYLADPFRVLAQGLPDDNYATLRMALGVLTFLALPAATLRVVLWLRSFQ